MKNQTRLKKTYSKINKYQYNSNHIKTLKKKQICNKDKVQYVLTIFVLHIIHEIEVRI